jgi:hypothetical protein
MMAVQLRVSRFAPMFPYIVFDAVIKSAPVASMNSLILGVVRCAFAALATLPIRLGAVVVVVATGVVVVATGAAAPAELKVDVLV